MHIAAVQFDIVWENKPANHRLVEDMLSKADVPPGAFVVLPELADTGFSLNVEGIVDDLSTEWGSNLARSRRIWLQTGYAQRDREGMGLNCATIFTPDGDAVGTYQKVHPFSYGKEIEHYTGGESLTIRRLADTPGRPAFCPLICYDLRFPELWRLGTVAGAEVFSLGANWPNARQAHWRALLIARAIENLAFVVAANRTGNDPHLQYEGGSMIISPRGEILAEAGTEPVVLQAEIDVQTLRDWRAEFGALADIHRDLLGSIREDSDA